MYGRNGYYLYLCIYYVTMWGILLGTMVISPLRSHPKIGVTDNVKALNWSEDFLGGKERRDLYLHIIVSAIILVATCIQGIESFS